MPAWLVRLARRLMHGERYVRPRATRHLHETAEEGLKYTDSRCAVPAGDTEERAVVLLYRGITVL